MVEVCKVEIRISVPVNFQYVAKIEQAFNLCHQHLHCYDQCFSFLFFAFFCGGGGGGVKGRLDIFQKFLSFGKTGFP